MGGPQQPKKEARVELKVEEIKCGHHKENQEGASVLTP